MHRCFSVFQSSFIPYGPYPRSAVALLAILAAFLPPARADVAQPRKTLITVDDLYRFDGPRSSAQSPDGHKVVYVRQWIDPRTKAERQALWLVEGKKENARPLEPGEPDGRSPAFSSDGKWIAFYSNRPRPAGWKQTPATPPQSETATDVWLIPAEGGAAIPLAGADKPYGRVFNDAFYGRIALSPDGRRLAFIADDGRDPRTAEEIAAGVEVVRPDQGEGYTGWGRAQLWVADLDEAPAKFAAKRVASLTPDDDVWYGDPQWSPDGRTLVVHANKTKDREAVRYSINKNYDLWQIDVHTHAARQLTTGPGPEVSARFSPDGKRMVCLSGPRKGSHADTFNLAIVTLGPGGPATHVLFDHHGPNAGNAPHPPPLFPLPEACWDDDDHVVYESARGLDNMTVRVDLRTGRAVPLPLAEGPEAEGTVIKRMKRVRELLPAGNAFLRDRQLGRTQAFAWKNKDVALEGVLTLPPAGVGTAPYPLVLLPHGGPHSRSTRGFNFNAEVFAAVGYAAFQPNFRGSAGYGQKFIDADRNDLGGGDMSDILSGIDALVTQKLVDADRQFVYGTSYGGFMTCWLVGHTNRFKAAAAQNAVTDLNAMWGLSDIQSWTQWEFGGYPWEVPAAMRRHSPLTYAAEVRTPTLVLHSRDDRRCPLPMGRMFYQALQANGVPTEMVIYPGEGHGIQQPRHREDVLRRVLAWFAKFDPARASGQASRLPGSGL